MTHTQVPGVAAQPWEAAMSQVRATQRSTPSEERGAALVEAALVLPLLLMLTFGIWTTSCTSNVPSPLLTETTRPLSTIS